MGCENQQYVQTERMSPTLHVPRHFPSHKSTHSHAGVQPRRLCQYSFLWAFHRSRFNNAVAQALCAVVNYHFSTGSTRRGLTRIMWKLLEKSGSNLWNSWLFWASGWSFVTAHYGDFTITMNSSLGDVSCPTGFKMRTLHTYTSLSHYAHIMFLHGLSTQRQPLSISSLYILRHRMETEIKLNKTLGAEAGLV